MSAPSTPGGGLRVVTHERRMELRELNLRAKSNRPCTNLISACNSIDVGEEDLSHLDSSLKKITTFIRRLKNITFDNYQSILDEYDQLKLSKYIAEVNVALLENKLKTAADIWALVEVISRFHQRYTDFSPFFLEGLRKEVVTPEPAMSEERVPWLARQRQLLRLNSELCIVGIIDDPRRIWTLLSHLLPEDDEKGPLHIPIAISFVKGVGPYFVELAIEESPPSKVIPAEWKSKFSDVLTSFFKAMGRLLVRTATRLRSLEARGRRHYETRGDLSTTQAGELQSTLESLEKLRANLQTLAELLNLNLPDLGTEVEIPQVMEGKIVFADHSIRMQGKASAIYDNDEERSLYEDILDLSERVPTSLLPNTSMMDGEISSEVASPVEEDLSDVVDIDPDHVSSVDEPLSVEDRTSASNIEAFFAKLPNMQSRALADQAAIDFCFITSKAMRRRLADRLIDLPQRRLDLLPFIGRLLRTLKPYFSDVPEAVCKSLVGQFIFLFHRKEPIIGTRSRICRYIGELTKFGVMPQTTVFAILKKTIIDDLTGFNIDMTTILLETCGRYLYNQPESHKRIISLFEVVNKKKNQGMEHSHTIMLENAMYMTNPPDRPIHIKKEKSPRLQYLFHLLRGRLEHGNAEQVFTQIRKFPWFDDECRDELMRAFSKMWKVKYGNIQAIASMIGCLDDFYPDFVIDLVDRVLEKIRYGLEQGNVRFNNRLISSVRYVGELFCYNVISIDVIFALLHQLVVFGHEGIPRIIQPSSIDPPENHFRIRLICILLQCCAVYITDPTMVEPFESFITLFEYYIATKTKPSMDIDYLLDDTFDELNRKRHSNQLNEVILRLVEESKGSLSFLLDDLNKEITGQSSIDESYEDAAPSYADRPIDDEFERALASMMASSIEERKLERKATPFDVPLPLSLLSPKSPSPSSSGGEEVSIRMLVKKKNKPVTKQIAVDPNQVSFVHSSLAGREKELEASDRVRRFVLASQRDVDNFDAGVHLAPRRQRSGRTISAIQLFGHRRVGP